MKVSTVGRAVEVDPWGREEELGGASCVAEFRRIDAKHSDEGREQRARALITSLTLESTEHALLTTHNHPAHPSSQRPLSLPVIAQRVKAKMEEYREAFMRMEEIWFERDVCVGCGGFIEVLVRAIEESSELLLRKEGDEGDGGRTRRSNWVVELVGADIPRRDRDLWADADEGNRSLDGLVPGDWTPGEGPHELPDGGTSDEYDYYEGESTGAEGDVSWGDSGEEEEEGEPGWGGLRGWGKYKLKRKDGEEEGDVRDWGSVLGDWGSDGEQQQQSHGAGVIPLSASSSTAGWDGDDDGSDSDTTS